MYFSYHFLNMNTIFCIDNSQSSLNGDFHPSRLRTQLETAREIALTRLDASSYNLLSVITMANRGQQARSVVVTLSADSIKLQKRLFSIEATSSVTSEPLWAIRTARLMYNLKRRHQELWMQRISSLRLVIFICSIPRFSKDGTRDQLASLAAQLREEQINVDVIIFGQTAEVNIASDLFQPFIEALGNGSQLLKIVAGQNKGRHFLTTVFSNLRSLQGQGRVNLQLENVFFLEQTKEQQKVENGKGGEVLFAFTKQSEPANNITKTKTKAKSSSPAKSPLRKYTVVYKSVAVPSTSAKVFQKRTRKISFASYVKKLNQESFRNKEPKKGKLKIKLPSPVISKSRRAKRGPQANSMSPTRYKENSWIFRSPNQYPTLSGSPKSIKKLHLKSGKAVQAGGHIKGMINAQMDSLNTAKHHRKTDKSSKSNKQKGHPALPTEKKDKEPSAEKEVTHPSPEAKKENKRRQRFSGRKSQK